MEDTFMALKHLGSELNDDGIGWDDSDLGDPSPIALNELSGGILIGSP
jgi:hypothetical protein